MDELLKRQPSQLADERTELFHLMDRFSAAVAEYRKQYRITVRKRDQDLDHRSTEIQEKLKQLADAQKKERNTAQAEHAARTAAIRKQCEQCQSQALSALQDQERTMKKTETEELSRLTMMQNEDEARNKAYRDVRDHITSLLGGMECLIGNGRLEKIRQELDIPKPDMSSYVAAVNAVSQRIVDQSDEIYRSVKDITESLPKTLIFYHKRNERIKELLKLEATAKEAVRWLARKSANEQADRKAKSDKHCQEVRNTCNRIKSAALQKRDKALQKLNGRQKQENQRFQSAFAKLSSDHACQYEAQKKYFTAQISAAQAQWQAQLEQCSSRFAAQMEAQFPGKRMNAWINQFWYHPRRVEDYGKVDFSQLNTLIGTAVVDISDWYKGEAGIVIKKVLTNYITLFGRNKAEATKAYQEAKIHLPYTLSIEGGTSLLISYSDGSDDRAKEILNAIGMRMLRSVPACLMRFQLFDANGIGAFGRLMSLDPALRNNPSEPTVKSFAIGEVGQVHSNQADITEQIQETKIAMDGLARQLTNFGSVREFNLGNPMSKQIYRPILMMNFPLGLREQELRTLNAMSADCSKWGFSMILAQPDKAVKNLMPEMQSALDELKKNVLCLRMEQGSRFLKVIGTSCPTEKNAKILIYGLPDHGKIPGIAEEIRRESVEASRVLIKFSAAKGVYPEKAEWFRHKADDGIVIPVGYIEGGRPFEIPFDDKHVNAVIMGNIGSGKTNLLHVLMTNLMLRYAPEEVMVCLIDFKYGLDFRMYTQYNLPNFRTISINNDPEFALAMLQNLEQETEERSLRMGSRFQKISEYNADNPGQRMNRILLIIDELYELVKRASDDVQKNILQKIDSFAHQQRAFGIHMVVCGQDLDKIQNFETIKNQCTIRLALRCGDSQVKLLMDEVGAARMHSIDATDQGACVFSLSGGTNPQVEHTVYLGAASQEKLLEEIHQHYLAKRKITNVKVLLTKVCDNPNHVIQMFVANGHLTGLKNNRLLLGEPISMEKELNLCPAEHLWITGGNASDAAMDAGNSAVFFAAVSLLMAKLKTGNMELVCTNCADRPLRGDDEEEKDLTGQLASGYPALFRYGTGDSFQDTLNALLAEFDRRRNRTKSCNQALWWFLIRPELLQGMGNSSATVIDLKELLQDGAACNIHIILWNADVKQAQKMQLDRTLFRDRICLEMSTEDEKAVNGSGRNPAPSGFKAVMIGGHAMRFRIYDLPDGKWMNALFERLNEYITH